VDDRPFDLDRIRTFPLAERPAKVRLADFGTTVPAGATLDQFLESLPRILAGRTLRGLAHAIIAAGSAGKPVIWALGGHVVKVGLTPVLQSMMERGRLQALAVNGAVAIHDFELAAVGRTSEDVGPQLAAGRFGMAAETGRALNEAAAEAAREGRGLGEVLARRIAESDLPHRERSLLAAARRHGVPVTVHVAVGSDVVHAHPGADGAALGAAAHIDFRRLISMVTGLGGGGVWINCGSAVLLPEVFLKAVAVAGNTGHDLSGMVTADLDMQRHYRPAENVLRRPVGPAGRSYSLTGHHEINVPLLAAAIEWCSRRENQEAVRPG
jgi:hypothetical protein